MKPVVTAEKLSLVWIKWLDHSSSNSGWKTAEDFAIYPLICESVGWIVKRGTKEGRAWVSICQNKVENKDVSDLMTIIEQEILEWAEIR